ncbi:hypothetical protein RSO41_08735 [Halomonas sp. I1]|uniref:hypothetical protein n=1 Tax=Halomonas sp. I1 TaxID=393536 RepID=UPI0028E04DE4|nr:hypothetical protein [Halomonas sp. I1]MDT8894744.1 hypothetical protein [Halomonas sp. I1]
MIRESSHSSAVTDKPQYGFSPAVAMRGLAEPEWLIELVAEAVLEENDMLP